MNQETKKAIYKEIVEDIEASLKSIIANDKTPRYQYDQTDRNKNAEGKLKDGKVLDS